jgi:hypothetical protein
MGVASADACQNAGASCGQSLYRPGLVASPKRYMHVSHNTNLRVSTFRLPEHIAPVFLWEKAKDQDQVLSTERFQARRYVIVLSLPFFPSHAKSQICGVHDWRT